MTRSIIVQWQAYRGVPQTGEWDTATEATTRSFQREHHLPESGQWDAATDRRAVDAGFCAFPRIGPDITGDVRETRPYFVVPIDEPVESANVRGRVARAAERVQPTDIFIISHGWHRNYFGALQAYDRLISRFAVLRRRERVVAPEPFRPLFLAMHWHSDPGPDTWRDSAGRRSRGDFMRRIENVFVRPPEDVDESRPPSQRYSTVFERAFQAFSIITASGVDPVLDSELNHCAAGLTDDLSRFDVLDAPGADCAEKLTVAWSCYAESRPQRVLIDQSEPARPFGNIFGRVLGTALAVASLIALIALVALVVQHFHEHWHARFSLVHWLGFTEADIRGRGGYLRYLDTSIMVLEGVSIVGAIGLGMLLAALPHAQGNRATHNSARTALAILGWLVLQVECAIPIMALIVLTFLGSDWRLALTATCCVSVSVWLGTAGQSPDLFWAALVAGLGMTVVLAASRKPPLLFTEKYRNADDTAPSHSYRDWGAIVARWPLRLLLCRLPHDHALLPLLNVIDSQLAFFEMQRKGVDAGRATGQWLSALVKECPVTASARLHLVGHSFGGLVVSNAARYLAEADTPGRLHTVCLVQGALASTWYNSEKGLRAKVRGSIASIYSAYDTACGTYYPWANSGRLAAGSVGLSPTGPDDPRPPVVLGKGGMFASLVEPPDLESAIPSQDGGARPDIVNLDASRVIFEGPPASGGGHTDIFKDDVLYLIWAVCQLGSRPTASKSGVTLRLSNLR